MMYDHEKSDLAIVAVKLTNKAGQTSGHEAARSPIWAGLRFAHARI